MRQKIHEKIFGENLAGFFFFLGFLGEIWISEEIIKNIPKKCLEVFPEKNRENIGRTFAKISEGNYG